MSQLTPQHVLADLFGSNDFPADIIDTEHAAEIVIERLRDAGFEIKPAFPELEAMPEETYPCHLTQLLRR